MSHYHRPIAEISPYTQLQTDLNPLQTQMRQVHSELRATVLHLMEIDCARLTYNFQGREFRLTDVDGVVIKKPAP